MKILQLLTLFSIPLFFGCSSSNEDEVPVDEFAGSFEVSITGDQTMDLEGEAFFLHAILTSKTDVENGSTIGVTLVNENNEDNIIIITVVEPGNLQGIGVGSYDVDLEEETAENEDSYATVSMYMDGSLITFLATSGEVKFTKIEDSKVEGTLTATLTNFNGETITISGKYNADGTTENL